MATISNASARHVFDIWELVVASKAPLSVTEIARQLGLPVSTTHRGLTALGRSGFVERYQASARYVPGPTSQHLWQAFFARFALRDLALPYLRDIAVLTGETTALSVPIGWLAVRIALVKGSNEIIHTGPLGEAQRLDNGPAGKAMLALFPSDWLTAFEAECRAAGSPCAPGLAEELAATRQRGFAVDGALANPGWGAATAAITASHGRPIAAIAIEGPVFDRSPKHRGTIAPRWLDIVKDLEQAARAEPSTAIGHYDHIVPSAVLLPSASCHCRPERSEADRVSHSETSIGRD